MTGPKSRGLLNLDRGLTNLQFPKLPTSMLIFPHLQQHGIASSFLIFQNGMAEKTGPMFTGRETEPQQKFLLYLLLSSPMPSFMFSSKGLHFKRT